MKSKPIKNYEENYLIFEDGKILNIKKDTYLKNVLNYRYYTVLLYKNNIRKQYYVHRLVAEAFCENRNNKRQVNHIDSNKLNNHYSNLEWVTPKENINHFINSKNYKKRVMSKDAKEKIAISKYKKVKCLITSKIYKSIKDFAKYKNVSITQASQMLNNKYYRENDLNGILV